MGVGLGMGSVGIQEFIDTRIPATAFVKFDLIHESTVIRATVSYNSYLDLSPAVATLIVRE